MGVDVRALLAAVRPAAGENRLVEAVQRGEAPLAAVAALAAEERLIVASDRRSFLTLAARAEDDAAAGFFAGLAHGESLALPLLEPLAAAAGDDPGAPRAGCQAYPAYVAWLALNAEPGAAALALVANFAAWGGYCAGLAAGLREHYGFGDQECAFLDFFAGEVQEMEAQALDAARHVRQPGAARVYARLLHDYETGFWRTLATVGQSRK